jgi:uncharacterized membrane protein YhaH (DUF805 family)
MRGTVFHYDQDQDYGYINGTDAKRYIFSRADLLQEIAVVRGTVVEFQPDDGTAHNIVAAVSISSSSAGQLRRPGRPAQDPPVGSTGLWAYFGRSMSVNYFNFNGRAPRREYWAFWLCFALALAALFGFGILVNLAINGFGINAGTTSIGFLPAIIFILALTPPWIALTVRRLHDAGLSGWFVWLCFIPAVSGVAWLVFGFMPSQVGDNPWGPMPPGIRL